jgi:hypothetical protein
MAGYNFFIDHIRFYRIGNQTWFFLVRNKLKKGLKNFAGE